MTCFRTILATLTVLSVSAVICHAQSTPVLTAPFVYANPKAETEARINDLMKRLTQDEKFTLLAQDSNNDGLRLNVPGIPRLGIPSLRTSDAPEGVKDYKPVTAFPMGVVMASTWDPALIQQVGAAIGQEAKARNRTIIYGPGVNIQRTPQDGRFFETYSEDPYLTSRIAVGYIEGMQSQGTAACVKHYLCNNQENGRHSDDIEVDERALHEIYMPAFEASVERAHVWSLMTALNQVNGTFVADSIPLLTDTVKRDWHWDGVVICDWGAIHDSAAAANAGIDIEMPVPNYFSKSNLTSMLKSGATTQDVIDDKVRRILRLMIRTGLLDRITIGPNGPVSADTPALPESVVNTPVHQALARKVADEGIILLKNDNSVLPLDPHAIKSIAVIGPNAANTPLGGRWSADVASPFVVNILDAVKAQATAGGVNVAFAQGCPRTTPGTQSDLDAAVSLAAKSDIAIVVVGTDNSFEGEEMDPPNLYLPGDQDKLVAAISAVNKRTIVVLNNGSPLLMDKWLPQAKGVVEAWYSGMETGNAVADVLFGTVNPSGKLTSTIGARREDYPDGATYPGANNVVHYTEGIYVGYRYFDKHNITPQYPFGYGLSYTTFKYSKLHVPASIADGQKAIIKIDIQNTGKRSGDEIAQLYIRDLNPKVDRPIRELKGFARVSLTPNQSSQVTFPIDTQSFSYWDSQKHGWQANPGSYEIEVGSSSRDIRAQAVIRLK